MSSENNLGIIVQARMGSSRLPGRWFGGCECGSGIELAGRGARCRWQGIRNSVRWL